jgi:AmmeMemoRadiSam system protein B
VTAGRVRPPAVAGSFYPAEPEALRAAVSELLEDAAACSGGAGLAPKALVAPHAGYLYSGPIAASAYARLVGAQDRIERVVLLGPAHRTPLAAVGASTADAFETPLGSVAVDTSARDDLVASGLVVPADDAHAAEHSLEVHLPFLQVALGEVRILPLVVGEVPAAAVVAVLDALWGGRETVVIVSTDLSHYRDHRTAQELDRRAAAAILSKRPEDVGLRDACGVFPLRGLLAAARRRGLDVEQLDLRTSADTVGDPDWVVGYGAFALVEP